jgi:hypothetical protein
MFSYPWLYDVYALSSPDEKLPNGDKDSSTPSKNAPMHEQPVNTSLNSKPFWDPSQQDRCSMSWMRGEEESLIHMK